MAVVIQQIPVQDGAPAWRQRTPLDGTDYLLDFFWNERASAWYISIFTVDGEPLLLSKKLVCGVPLLARKRWDSRIPPGEIMAVDWNDSIDVPGLENLGEAVILYYLDRSAIEEIRA